MVSDKMQSSKPWRGRWNHWSRGLRTSIKGEVGGDTVTSYCSKDSGCSISDKSKQTNKQTMSRAPEYVHPQKNRPGRMGYFICNASKYTRCLFLCFIDPRVSKIRNKASSCPGLFALGARQVLALEPPRASRVGPESLRIYMYYFFSPWF